MSKPNPGTNRQTAYITRSSVCLPNAPVENDQVEAILGQVGERPSRARRIVQRSNGIRRRYYVIDPSTGKPNYTNASLTAAAIRGLAGNGFDLDDLACLACGTSNPDQLMPNHAVMVHGELGVPVCEVVATAGVCVSGATALKYGWLSVMSGDARNAVVTGSETASLGLLAQNYGAEPVNGAQVLEASPELAFEKDFLRWMLSDGAGALLLEPAPRPGLNLRVEWVDIFSYAHLLPACMYVGAEKQADGALRGWMLYSAREREASSVFALKQDVRLLNEEVIEHTLVKPLARVIANRGLSAEDVDWFLPHYSSEYFRAPVSGGLARAGLPIPQERWFTNLERVGNVGSASIYIMLDELIQSGRLHDGQHLLCWVPESGRFSSGFIYLTVVAHA
ncbi:MAG TPA: beta-ketoacyl-ACP synthase III [Burkholderiales bacterium]|nr:beta-ketoacyl-ACP synthase III [Burkholderiales bacterium]